MILTKEQVVERKAELLVTPFYGNNSLELDYIDTIEAAWQERDAIKAKGPLKADIDQHQRALLKVRLALGLDRDSEDDLVDVIIGIKEELEALKRGY